MHDQCHPIDLHVGARMRARRKQLRISQVTLAKALGVAFQQVQKYEAGDNRLSASRLYALAEALDCPIGYFFAGLDEGVDRGANAAETLRIVAKFITTQEGPELAAAFCKIKSGPLRRQLLDLIATLASRP